jgi:hypothetical protein
VEPTNPNSLAPELRETELLLQQALAEACDAPPATEIDTGELIRVEEMLGIATEAAKRAIALRHRRRQARKGGGARAAMGDAEAATTGAAIHRAFLDRGGATWDVFAVYPAGRLSPHSQLPGTYPQGWLCFESGAEKRRLSPIPDDWQTLSDEQLELLFERAETAGRRRGRSGDNPGPSESRLPRE